jgi:hypothetical protein
MRQLWLLVLVLSLVACGQPTQTDMVEALLAKPERLKALRAQCKTDHDKVGDAVCAAVSEATRRRFMVAGKSPYANDPVMRPSSPAQPVSPRVDSPLKD